MAGDAAKWYPTPARRTIQARQLCELQTKMLFHLSAVYMTVSQLISRLSEATKQTATCENCPADTCPKLTGNLHYCRCLQYSHCKMFLVAAFNSIVLILLVKHLTQQSSFPLTMHSKLQSYLSILSWRFLEHQLAVAS